MSLHRYAKARDRNEPEIVAALEQVGATVVRLDRPVDLLVGYRGRNFLLEVKRKLGPKGGQSHAALSDSQIQWIQSWRGKVAVVRTAEQALDAITS